MTAMGSGVADIHSRSFDPEQIRSDVLAHSTLEGRPKVEEFFRWAADMDGKPDLNLIEANSVHQALNKRQRSTFYKGGIQSA